ncbi:MAG: SDR family NAD(P)-dependent oxidoreductase [Promethearchaeota archaeon]|jgi:NAD(P)-dependent dehydrogenase (short-subunit alcohol dehydrogenase family)
MSNFKGKIAVITGAASGIGFGLAEKFVHEGIKVVLADIEVNSLNHAAKKLEEMGGDVLSVVTDVSKIDDVRSLAEETIEKFGIIHILCNNAGVGFAGNSSTTIWENSLSEWKWILGVNLWGVIHGIHVFVPIMLNQDVKCFIINTCSTSGLISPPPWVSIYSITKHAIIAITESLRTELQHFSKKIKVLALCPGFVLTNLINSERNRPEELYNEVVTSPQLDLIMNIYRQSIEKGISPQQVAEILFQSLNGDKFYIPTDRHRFYGNVVKRRMEAILKDFQK